jgi:hypothetical protein
MRKYMLLKIVKLIDSNQHIFENKPYGLVDVRTTESETEEEKQAAIESLKSYNYSTDGKNILRLVGIFEGETIKKVMLDSEIVFEEIIDLLKRQPVTRTRNCDGAGYWVNMDTGETMPFQKPHEQQDLFLNHVFQMSLGPYSPMLGEQIISSCKNEAIEAFIRSIHWFNDSKLQTKSYLQFLYKWIAIETIAKIEIEEDIVPKLCLIIGFPLSKYYKTTPMNETEKLITKGKYKFYKEIIRKEFYKCREIRNSIVHSGFKEVNIINENMELKLYLIDSVYSCMINTIEKIILLGKNKLKEIWDVMSEYIMKNENMIKWVSGVFILEIERIRSQNIKNV